VLVARRRVDVGTQDRRESGNPRIRADSVVARLLDHRTGDNRRSCLHVFP
jgi:hypothetical protein